MDVRLIEDDYLAFLVKAKNPHFACTK